MGHTLTAQVPGTRLYEVEIDVASGIHARCSCPYNWGGYCKHIGAVLLKWVQTPGAFVVNERSATSDDYPIEVTPVEPPPTRRPNQDPFWMTTSVTERQQADDMQLSRWLGQMKIQDLRQMARKRDWPVKGSKKTDIVRQIIERITQPDDLDQAIHRLDAEHSRVFRAMVLLDRELARAENLERIARSWGELTQYQQLKAYISNLSEIGLVIPADIGGQNPSDPDFVPQVIIRRLSSPLEDVIPAARDLPSDLPAGEIHLADPYSLVRTAHQVTLMLEQHPIALRSPMPRPRLEKFYDSLAEWDYDPNELKAARQEGKLERYSDLTLNVPPPNRSLAEAVIERLAPMAGDEVRLEFIFSLLVAAGLFQPGSPVTVWPEVKEQFLRRPELDQRAILARVYFLMTNWNELWEVLRVQKKLQLRRNWSYSFYKPKQLQGDLVNFRRLVLRVLACLPDGQWIAMDDLLPLMRAVWPRFDSTLWQRYSYGHRTGNWFLAGEDDQPLSETNPQDWWLAQWNFIRQLITGPLHWLGLVDLGFKNEILAHIRLHGLADLYWDRIETPDAPPHAAAEARSTAPSPAQAVIVDNETITVDPSAISAQAHSLLDRIAHLDEVAPERFIYNLDPHIVHETFEDGVMLSKILEDWERLLSMPMPAVVETRLTEWWQAYGQVRIYEDVTIIEFDDDYTLVEMKAVTSLEKRLIAEITPRLVLVPREAVEPLTAELEKAGYTPKQTDQV
jgi:hypothetical protein